MTEAPQDDNKHFHRETKMLTKQTNPPDNESAILLTQLLTGAILKKDLESVRNLISKGAQNLPIMMGYTPLFWVLQLSDETSKEKAIKINILKNLLAMPNNNINYAHEDGTALHAAAEMEDSDYAKILLSYGANPNIKNKEGLTPLQYILTIEKNASQKQNGNDAKTFEQYEALVEKQKQASLTKSEFKIFTRLSQKTFRRYHALKNLLDLKPLTQPITPSLSSKHENQSPDSLFEILQSRIYLLRNEPKRENELYANFLEVFKTALDYDGGKTYEENVPVYINILKQLTKMEDLVDKIPDPLMQTTAFLILGYHYLGYFHYDPLDTIVNINQQRSVSPAHALKLLDKSSNKIQITDLPTNNNLDYHLHAARLFANYLLEYKTVDRVSALKEKHHKKSYIVNYNTDYLFDVISKFIKIYKQYFDIEKLNFIIQKSNQEIKENKTSTFLNKDITPDFSHFLCMPQALSCHKSFLLAAIDIYDEIQKMDYQKEIDQVNGEIWCKFFEAFKFFYSCLESLIHICKETKILDQTEEFEQKLKTVKKIYDDFQEEKKNYDQTVETKRKNSDKMIAQLNAIPAIRKKFLREIKANRKPSPSKSEEINLDNKNNSQDKKTSDQQPIDRAFSLFQTGQYQKAIQEHEKLLPEKINKENCLQALKLKIYIAECYFALSKATKQKEAYLQQTKKNYDEGLDYAKKGMAENDSNSIQYQKFETYHYFITATQKLLDQEKQANSIEFQPEENRPIKTVPPKNRKTKKPSKKKQIVKNNSEKTSVSESSLEPTAIRLNKTLMDLLIKINEIGKNKINSLEEPPCHVYLVGGYIRDHFLKRVSTSMDIDIVIRNISLREVRVLLSTLQLNFHIYGAKYSPIIQVKLDDMTIDISALCSKTPGKQDFIELDNGGYSYYTPTDSLEIDVQHRDCRANALFYDPFKKCVIDPTKKGLEDIKNKILNPITDHESSLKEDPVRIFRAIDMEAKLGFRINPKMKSFILSRPDLIAQLTFRQFYNSIKKIFLNGNAEASFKLLFDYKLLHQLFPSTQIMRSNVIYKNMANSFFKSLDEKLELFDEFSSILAVLLWGELKETCLLYKFDSNKNQKINSKIEVILAKQQQILELPQYIIDNIKEIWKKMLLDEPLTSIANLISYSHLNRLEKAAELKLTTSYLEATKSSLKTSEEVKLHHSSEATVPIERLRN